MNGDDPLRHWRKSLQWQLAGVSAHIEPGKALAGLTAEQAGLPVPGGLHSAHRLLHHLVYWQDLMLAPVAGVEVQWPKGPEDWASEMPPWAELCRRFTEGIARAHGLAQEADLARPIPAWGPEMTAGGALGAVIIHNSYHLGQLIDARRATGRWPPASASPQ